MQQPLLNPEPPPGQEEKVAGIFAMLEEQMGFVPDGLRLYAISPPLLESFLGAVGYFSSESPLGPKLAAMIRYLVSYRAGCTFCIDLNEAFLSGMGLDLDSLRAARRDPDAAPLEPRELPLLRLALQAVSEPDAVNAEELENARRAGWDDRAIFDAVAIATSNSAFNLMLRTFKVEHQGVFAA